MGHADSVDAIVRYASGRRLLAQTVQYFHTDELRLIVSHYMLVRCRIFVYGGLRSREATGQLNTATISMLSSTPLDFSPGSVEAGTAIAAWEDAAALPNVLKSRHMPLLGACWLRVRIIESPLFSLVARYSCHSSHRVGPLSCSILARRRR